MTRLDECVHTFPLPISASPENPESKKGKFFPFSTQAAARMSDEKEKMIDDLKEIVTTAVTELFSTMLGMDMRPTAIDEGLNDGEAHVAGAVGFIGRLTGVVYIYTTVPFARRITATLLGLSEAEVEGDEMVNDAMGEMANMLVGNMKSRLSDRGMCCVLTIPSVVRGSHFSVEAVTSVEGQMFSFEAENNILFIEVMFKATEQSQSQS